MPSAATKSSPTISGSICSSSIAFSFSSNDSFVGRPRIVVVPNSTTSSCPSMDSSIKRVVLIAMLLPKSSMTLTFLISSKRLLSFAAACDSSPGRHGIETTSIFASSVMIRFMSIPPPSGISSATSRTEIPAIRSSECPSPLRSSIREAISFWENPLS